MMTHASINLTCLHCSNPNVPARPQMVKLLLNVCKLRLAQASLLAALGQKVSAVALAGLLSVAPLAPAIASEFGVMTEDIPAGYIIDDAGVLNSVTRGDLRQKLKALEEQTGSSLTGNVTCGWHYGRTSSLMLLDHALAQATRCL